MGMVGDKMAQKETFMTPTRPSPPGHTMAIAVSTTQKCVSVLGRHNDTNTKTFMARARAQWVMRWQKWGWVDVFFF